MVIESLDLTNFRNFESRKLVFHCKNVFLTGPNGTGKTNLLESIAFASLLRSFRGSPPREMIRLGSREFQLRVALRTAHGTEWLRILERASGGRELLIGDAAVRRSSEFIREFHAVAFVPEDREIASGSSSFRRRFFDILISTIEPEYLFRLGRYSRALLQRNRALKFAPKTVAAFEPELAEQAPLLADARRRYAASVTAEVSALLAGRAAFEIHYRTDTAENPEAHRKLLASKRENELRRQCTLSGPQLDEFELLFDGKPQRTYGSTGQIRLISLLLKLAQFKLVKRSSRAPVVVLADDVTGELDAGNLELFLSTIDAAEHAFFTFAERPRFGLSDMETVEVAPFKTATAPQPPPPALG